MREREMVKGTKCLRVNSIKEVLINTEFEVKITYCLKKKCKNSMVKRRSVKKILAKNSVTRPMKYIVDQS